jgi:hypothetical protein
MPKDEFIDEKQSIKNSSHAERLFRYAWDQRLESVEPWFPEYGILHRLNFADLNNQLAICKKKIYEKKEASRREMRKLRRLLNEQGTAPD